MDILITIAVLTAIAGGVLSSVVADAKNRSVLGWAIAGAIFPVLGLIAIAGMPVAEPTQQQTSEENSEGAPVKKSDGRIIAFTWAGIAIFILLLGAYGASQ